MFKCSVTTSGQMAIQGKMVYIIFRWYDIPKHLSILSTKEGKGCQVTLPSNPALCLRLNYTMHIICTYIDSLRDSGNEMSLSCSVHNKQNVSILLRQEDTRCQMTIPLFYRILQYLSCSATWRKYVLLCLICMIMRNVDNHDRLLYAKY
jgi:hypothetical protein